MALIRERPWQEIEERLLGQLTLGSLRPIPPVLRELETEAGTLWRDDKRGKPKSREIESKIAELRKQARLAAENDKKIRRLEAEIEALDVHRESLEQRRLCLKKKQIRFEKLIPCGKLLRKIEGYRKEAGDEEELSSLPEQPRETRHQLQLKLEQLQQKMAEFQERQRILEAEMTLFTERDKKVLDLASEIGDWVEKQSSYHDLLQQLSGAESDLSTARTGLSTKAAALSVPVPDQESVEAIMVLREDVLTNGLQDFQLARDTFQSIQKEASSKSATVWYLPAVFLATLGLSFSVVSHLKEYSLFLTPGLVLFAFGTAWFAAGWVRWRQNRRRCRQQLSQAEDAFEGSRGQLHQLLAPIALPAGRLENSDLKLTGELLQFKAAVNEICRIETRVAGIRSHLQGIDDSLSEWLNSVEVSFRGSGFEAVRDLKETKESAALREVQVEHAARSVLGVREEIQRFAEEIEHTTADLKQLESRLQELGDGNVEAGLVALERRQEASRKASHFRESLEEDFPDWRELEVEIEELVVSQGFDLECSTEEIARCQCDLEDVTVEMRRVSNDRLARQKDIQHLGAERNLSDLESEIAHLQSKLADVKFRRDRLLLLSGIISHGNQRFREAHQPDVLRRAGEYLSLITGGRYVRIDFDQEEQQLEVLPGQRDHALPVSKPLSQGVRDQIYLALRLALVEHLDQSGEKLPLFFDEILVNWDTERRRLGYGVIERILAQRQLFMFTCHEWLADEVGRNLGGKQVNLSAQ
jgi:DNA repair exonuclease SbcCD ATPase subunit